MDNTVCHLRLCILTNIVQARDVVFLSNVMVYQLYGTQVYTHPITRKQASIHLFNMK